MHIGKREIGPDVAPTFIAELSGNHNGSLDRALALVDAMADAGAHVIKLQTYTADTMTIDCDAPDFVISHEDGLWSGHTLHQLYEIAHTPWEWHEPLFAHAHARGVPMISTPFDTTAVDFLESLGTPAYKIASFESQDHELLRAVGTTAKPVILSTGMSSLSELATSVAVLRDAGAKDIVLLKCTSAYPARPEDANLATIPNLRETFRTEVGLSDHTLGLAVPIAAVTLGATVIEKHVTLRRADGGVDSAFSLEPDEVRMLVTEIERAWRSIGRVEHQPLEAEKGSMQFRRSLYFVEDLEKGATITPSSVRAIRPGYGLPPAELPNVIGRRARRAIRRGTAVDKTHLL